MNEEQQGFLLECLSIMLTPVAKFCLHRSIKLQDILECLKRRMIQLALEEANKTGMAVNGSKLSIMTGVHRKDIARIHQKKEPANTRQNALIRVVSQWQTDRKYTSAAGRPRVLTVGTNDSEFSKLVWKVSSDLSPGSVFEELKRIGLVRSTRQGVKLLAMGFMPRGDLQNGYRLMANDTKDLMQAVEENLGDAKDVPNLHVKVEYDNVCIESVPKIRKWLLKKGSEFHARALRFVSQYDRDVNPNLECKAGRARVVIGGFSLTALDAEEHRVA